jgi:predicted oxidoreductase
VFGDFLAANPTVRKNITIATKCGIRPGGNPNPDSPGRYDFSASHILWSCEQSLKRLRIDTIDIYQLHRPDFLMDPSEVAEAFGKLQRQGKVRHFGVSNFAPSYVSLLQHFCPMPLLVNQVQIHLGDLHTLIDGTLDQCIKDGITPLAWSPLGGGFLGAGGSIWDKDPHRELRTKLQAAVDEVAAQHGVSRTVVSLAWLLKHPSRIVPIVGSAKPANIVDATKADALDLSREDWYRLLIAARGERLP